MSIAGRAAVVAIFFLLARKLFGTASTATPAVIMMCPWDFDLCEASPQSLDEDASDGAKT